MCKKIIAVAAVFTMVMSLAQCQVNKKDYSSISDTDAAASQANTGSIESTDGEKVIGYDIYRPGSETSSVSDNSGNTSAASSADSTVSSVASSSTSSNTTSSDKTSSGTIASVPASDTSSVSSKTSSANTSSDSTSSYYDDWEGDNVIDFSELLGGNP